MCRSGTDVDPICGVARIAPVVSCLCTSVAGFAGVGGPGVSILSVSAVGDACIPGFGIDLFAIGVVAAIDRSIPGVAVRAAAVAT
jgi:hypothetical protein